MKIKIFLLKENLVKEMEMPNNSKVKDLIKALGFTVQGTVVLRDGTPIVEEENLMPEDKITVILTATGG
ncbi:MULTISPECIES: MoaD/ThiS family protein [Acidianus]|uniref:Thiamine biosynthesis protein ThiS n=1 Tax=Candidatus Acidianus copahuensis TaxID=1160895 RepID=A0A031LLG4_9CREN|nr:MULTISPECIES: MoaD/ThiS family protein [Acidianus]EZQ01743.1 thiamine biosynthesis protein ThiS [Candidatus Acidianus copahuensis]NON63576.1 thiamine biosynthesis protein ThiS [Acidianus sp. RZ1]